MKRNFQWRKDFASNSGSPDDKTIKLAEESGLEAVDIIKKLCQLTGDTFELQKYERKTEQLFEKYQSKTEQIFENLQI